MTVKGVGPKVADCTMLFGMYKIDAFPKDVWVKRVMAQWYPDGLPECMKGTEGIAQQYLFHYIRNLERQ
jgi:N-glycosylase/DNA lyase